MKMINSHAIFIQESDSHGGCVKEKFPAIYRNFVALYNNSMYFFLFTLFYYSQPHLLRNCFVFKDEILQSIFNPIPNMLKL